jgi:hypothetical protein
MRKCAHSEIRIASCGRILAHNLTPELAAVLAELNPGDDAMRVRADAIRMTSKIMMKNQDCPDGVAFGILLKRPRTA